MRKELEKRAHEVVAIARKAGARDAWATATRSRSVEFMVRNGKLEEVKDSTARSLSLRLFVDGRYSSHSTTDLRPERLEAFVREAVSMTRALQPDPHRHLPEPTLFANLPGDLDLVDGRVAGLEREQRIAWLQAMNSRIAGKEGVISAESGVFDVHAITAVAGSNGFSGAYEATMIGLSAGVTLSDGDRRPEEYMMVRGHHVSALPAPEAVADEALTLARARLGAIKGATQRTTMVVDRRAAVMLLARLLGPAHGSMVQQERSYFGGRLGQKVLSDKLTVIDEPLIKRGLGSRPFDSEGIGARRLPIIEAGVLQNLYLDTYYARKLGMTPTTGDSSNRLVVPGSRSRDQLVAEVGSGVYVTAWLGGNMDTTTGDFSFGIRGHLIERGAIGTPVGEMNVTGNMVELFGNVLEVGNDPWQYSPVQTPTMVFGGVQVSGARTA